MNLQISEGWVSGGWGQTLFSGAQQQDKGQWAQTEAQEVLSEHEEEFRVLSIFLAFPISLRTVNSTNASPLKLRLSPVLTSPMTSFALVSIRSSIASPQVGVSITWLQKLSSMHSRNLLDCLQLAVLLLQQMSGWLMSPSRTRDGEHKASWSWRKKASSVGSP